MNILDQLLEKRGLTFEELKGNERNQYLAWLKQLENSAKPLMPEDIRRYIRSAREAVEMELVDCEEYNYVLFFRVVNRKHVGLKARLKNYLLLEAFLGSKERAKEVLEKQIGKMAGGDIT